MKTCRIAIALIVVCYMFSVNQVLAQEITRSISAGENGKVKATFDFGPGQAIAEISNVEFNIAVTGTAKIAGAGLEGDGFSESFSSSGGTIASSSHEVILVGGPNGKTFTLVETYDVKATAVLNLVNTLLNDPTFEDGVNIQRTINVPPEKTLTVKITFDSTLRDLSATISGDVTGNVFYGTVPSSVSLALGFPNEILKGETLKFSGNFNATLASNTVIEAQVSPPTDVAAAIEVVEVDGSDNPFVTSTLNLSASAIFDGKLVDAASSPGSFVIAWFKNGIEIPGETGLTLSGQFAKTDKIKAQVIAKNLGGQISVDSNEITIINSPPAPPTGVTITHDGPADGPTTTSTLSANFLIPADPDGDPVTAEITWTVDPPFEGQTTFTDRGTLGPGIPKGTKIELSVLLKDNDGGKSELVEATAATINNTPPTVALMDGAPTLVEGVPFEIPLDVVDPDLADLGNVTVTVELTAVDGATPGTGADDPQIDGLGVTDNPRVTGTAKNIVPDGNKFTFVVTVNDGEVDGTPLEFTASTQSVNNPPTITADPTSLSLQLVDAGVSGNVTVTGEDIDGEDVSLTAFLNSTGLPNAAKVKVDAAITSFNDATGASKTFSVSFVLDDMDPNESVVFEVEFTAKDTVVPPGAATISVSIGLARDALLNLPPQGDIPSQTAEKHNNPEDDIFTLDLSGIFSDPEGTALTFAKGAGTALDNETTITDSTLTINYSKVDPGTYNINVDVIDSPPQNVPAPQDAKTIMDIFSLQVLKSPNDGPEFVAIIGIPADAKEGDSLSLTVIGKDVDREQLTIVGVSIPDWLSPGTVTHPFENDPELTARDFSGTIPFDAISGPAPRPEKISVDLNFTTTDAAGVSASGKGTLDISDVDQPPTVADRPNRSIDEGSALQIDLTGLDPDGDSFTFSLVTPFGDPVPAANETLEDSRYTLNLDGLFDLLPIGTAELSRTVEFEVSAPAPNRQQNRLTVVDDGKKLQVEITIKNVVDKAVIDPISDVTMFAGTIREISGKVSREKGSPLPAGTTLSVNSTPATAFLPGTITPAADGTFTLALEPPALTDDTFNVEIGVTIPDGTATRAFQLEVKPSAVGELTVSAPTKVASSINLFQMEIVPPEDSVTNTPFSVALEIDGKTAATTQTNGSHLFEDEFQPGTHNWTVTATPPGSLNRLQADGIKEQTGSFEVPNTKPTVEIFGPSSGVAVAGQSIPFSVSLGDIDEDILVAQVVRTDTSVPIKTVTISANNVWNFDVSLDVPTGVYTFKAEVTDGNGGEASATTNISIFNPDGLIPGLTAPQTAGAMTTVTGTKDILATINSDSIDLPLSVELNVNGRGGPELPANLEQSFEFPDVLLQEGENTFQAQVSGELVLNRRIPTNVQRNSRLDGNGQPMVSFGGTPYFELTFDLGFQGTTYRFTGPFSDELIVNADTKPPEIEYIGPTGTVAEAGTISAFVNDQNLKTDTITFKVGSRSPVIASYDSATGIASHTPTTVLLGVVTVTVTARDTLDNEASVSEKFEVDPNADDKSPPSFSDRNPSPGAIVADTTINVSVIVADGGAGPDDSKISVEVTDKDGTPISVTPAYNPIDTKSGRISFSVTPPSDGPVNIKITVFDKATPTPNEGTVEWTFFRDNTPNQVSLDELALCVKEGPITITGKVEPAEEGVTIELFRDGISLGTTTADATAGTFTFTSVDLTVNLNTFKTTAKDAGGNVSTSNAVSTTLDTEGPVLQFLSPDPNAQPGQVICIGTVQGGALVDIATVVSEVRATAIDNCTDIASTQISARVGGQTIPILGTFNADSGLVSAPLPGDFCERSLAGNFGQEFTSVTFIFSAADSLGNTSSLTVEARIQVVEETPEIRDVLAPSIFDVKLAGNKVHRRGFKSLITTTTPIISASLSDESKDLTASILVNGTDIGATYDPATSKVEGQVTLGVETDNSVQIFVEDPAKNANVFNFTASISKTFFPAPTLGSIAGVIDSDGQFVTQGPSVTIPISVLEGNWRLNIFLNGSLIPPSPMTVGRRGSSLSLNFPLDGLNPGRNVIEATLNHPYFPGSNSTTLVIHRDVDGPEAFIRNPVNNSNIGVPNFLDVRFFIGDRGAAGVDEDTLRGTVAIFEDGFESGDVTVWSATVGAPNRLLSAQAPLVAVSFDAPSGDLGLGISNPLAGNYQVTVIADDKVGNPLSSTFRWVIDGQGPSFSFIKPTDGETVPVKDPEFQVQFIPAADVDSTSIEAQLFSMVGGVDTLIPTSNDYNFATGILTVTATELPDAPYRLDVSAEDPVGNPAVPSSLALARGILSNRLADHGASVSFSVSEGDDTTPPVIIPLFPPPGGVINDPGAFSQIQAFFDDYSDIAFPITLIVNGVTYIIEGEGQAFRLNRGVATISLNRLAVQQFGGGPTSLNPLELGLLENPLELGLLERGLGVGLNTVELRVNDIFNNSSIAEWSFTLVVDPPSAPTIDALDAFLVEGSISVSGQVPGASTNVTVTVFANEADLATIRVSADSTFTVENIPLIRGPNTISAIATDIAGNQSERSESQTVFRDVEAPKVSINTLPAIVGNVALTVTGTASDDSSSLASISLVLNDGAPQDLATTENFSADVTLLAGENTIRVDVADTVGNTNSATVTVTLDSDAPTTAPAGLTAQVNATGDGIQLAWEADPNASVYNVYRADSEITALGNSESIATGVNGTSFADIGVLPGNLTYYALTSVDAAGNEGTVVSNSPNAALITNRGGTVALADGTLAEFGLGVILRAQSLTASVSMNPASDDSLPELPDAIVDSAREISAFSQTGDQVAEFSGIATFTLAFPAGAESPRIFILSNDRWVQLENQLVDTENDTVSTSITSPGIYRLGKGQPVGIVGDVNSDGTVNIFDLVIVGSQFGQTPPSRPEADVNGDGTVNIFDLVLVAGNFGQSIGSPAVAPVAYRSGSSQPNVEIQMVAEARESDPTLNNLVTVQVLADSGMKLGGIQFDLHFDTKQLTYVGSTKGSLFEAQGVQSYWMTPQVTHGSLMLASAVINASSASVSSDLPPVFAQVTFRIQGDVTTAMKSIRLENVQVADLEGRSIRANWRNQVDVKLLENFQNALLQNFPNPFNPETWIPYSIAEDAHVTVKIYDVLGRSVRTVDVGFVSAGNYVAKERAVFWDGRNKQGERVASGVYFYTMEAGSFVATKKLLILK